MCRIVFLTSRYEYGDSIQSNPSSLVLDIDVQFKKEEAYCSDPESHAVAEFAAELIPVTIDVARRDPGDRLGVQYPWRVGGWTGGVRCSYEKPQC